MTAAEVLAVTALAVAGTVLLACAAVVLVALRSARAQRRELTGLAAEVQALRDALAQATAPATAQAPDETDGTSERSTPDAAAGPAAYVITAVGDEQQVATGGQPVPGRIEGRLFADLVLRESVVKAAALAHGVRRAASAETRDRVRLEVRRELRRARRQRRADLRAARRHVHAQQRADLAAGEDAA